MRWLLPATALVGLAACGLSVTTKSRSVSPDGHYAATLTVKDCGALCSPSATVTLHDLQNRLGKGDIELFDGVGGWPIELHWIGPRTMVLAFCGGDRFKVRSNILESSLSEDGKPYPKINILVVSDERMVINGKAYCRFPEPEQKDAGSPTNRH